MATQHDIVKNVLSQYGKTYAEEAGIKLANRPSPLYELSVLTMLLSARISGHIALSAARELFKAGFRTPARMADATWQERVDALGRGHYRRYDERTATMLGDGAELIQDRWRGDLRAIRGAKLRDDLTQIPGIGPTGSDIFCREVQEVWPELRPFVDQRARRGAEALDLPTDPEKLQGLVDDSDLTRFIDGLVRITLDEHAAQKITESKA